MGTATRWFDRLYVGDCIQLLAGWPKSRKVHLVFADPPYNIGYEYDIYQDRRAPEEYLEWTKAWLEAVHRVLVPTGTLWVAIGDEYAAELKWIAEKEVGFHLRSWVVWYYTFGVHCEKKFARSHTHLLYFVKDPQRFTFNAEAIRVPSARRLVYDDARTNPRGRVPDNTWILRPQDAVGCFRPDQDTWFVSRVAGSFRERAGFHSCQLPEKVVARAILACSHPGQVVLDPFAGSGTTLVVAKKLGRHWVGMELSASYARHAEARVRAVRCGDPLAGPEDPIQAGKATPIFRAWEQQHAQAAQIVKAFQQVARGRSVDRILADPAWNARFLDACSRLQIPGRPVDWNLTLLRLRKQAAAGLQVGRKGRRIAWDRMEPFVHASEMAVRKLLDQGYPSIDYILCDPRVALLLDQYARQVAPGFPAVCYRWAALSLRKSLGSLVRQAWRLPEDQRLKVEEMELVGLESDRLRKVAETGGYFGLEIVDGKGRRFPLFIGETQDLFRKLQTLQGATEALLALSPKPGVLHVWWHSAPERSRRDRRAVVASLIERHQPALNYWPPRRCRPFHSPVQS
jgi:DNA modification methylase